MIILIICYVYEEQLFKVRFSASWMCLLLVSALALATANGSDFQRCTQKANKIKQPNTPFFCWMYEIALLESFLGKHLRWSNLVPVPVLTTDCTSTVSASRRFVASSNFLVTVLQLRRQHLVARPKNECRMELRCAVPLCNQSTDDVDQAPIARELCEVLVVKQINVLTSWRTYTI